MDKLDDMRAALVRADEQHERNREAVRRLGAAVGYGAMMHLASELWAKELGGEAGCGGGGAFAVGPCRGLLVPCECAGTARGCEWCEWCEGTGQVTERVRATQVAVAEVANEPTWRQTAENLREALARVTKERDHHAAEAAKARVERDALTRRW